MIFRRNLFYPLRLLLYPMLAVILFVSTGVQISLLLDVVITAISALFLIEAIWESATPYLVFNDDEIIIYESIIRKRKINIASVGPANIHVADWEVQIGQESINLRKIRRGYRDQFAEEFERRQEESVE